MMKDNIYNSRSLQKELKQIAQAIFIICTAKGLFDYAWFYHASVFPHSAQGSNSIYIMFGWIMFVSSIMTFGFIFMQLMFLRTFFVKSTLNKSSKIILSLIVTFVFSLVIFILADSIIDQRLHSGMCLSMSNKPLIFNISNSLITAISVSVLLAIISKNLITTE